MGQEINSAGFEEEDFAAFSDRLANETYHLREAFASRRLSDAGPRIGFELEAWLIDHNCFPVPHNESFLRRLDSPLVVPELSRFNIELNGMPQPLAGDGLWRLEKELEATWTLCVESAHEGGETLVAIGTLPTLRESDLSLSNMTPSNRYVALNRELVRARGGAPILVDIDSAIPDGEHLQTSHLDVMLEAATTSLQLHLQVAADRIAANINASSILSAPLVALSANSPFLFGRALWHETRIPVFEQAFEQGSNETAGSAPHRVTFGNGYVGKDPTALFAENLSNYAVLLPMAEKAELDRYACLRLHNGTIWRWNRPLVGFDDDGTPHLRMEQRIFPAGPTLIDMMANAAFFYGAVQMLAENVQQPEKDLPFPVARNNFYLAAKHGLDAEIVWMGGEQRPVTSVLADLLPLAREGLDRQGVSEALIDRYLEVIAVRLATGRNGAGWQLEHYVRHGDLFRLTAEYIEHQRSGMPVHEWPV